MGRWEKTPVSTVEIVTEPGEAPSAHERCYLSPYANCSTKLTREHFISKNILERITASTLKFENAGHFFGGKSNVEIGIDSFSAKVLCDRHNSALSPLDTSAGLAFSAIDALARDVVFVHQTGRTVQSFHLASGIDIERWLVKVYCALVAAGKIRSLSGRVLGEDAIKPHLLEALLGRSSLVAPLGLYLHTFPGQQRAAGSISFGTIQTTDGSDEVGGIMLSLGLVNFVLVVSELYGHVFRDQNWYRHQELAWNVDQGGSRIAFLFTY